VLSHLSPNAPLSAGGLDVSIAAATVTTQIDRWISRKDRREAENQALPGMPADLDTADGNTTNDRTTMSEPLPEPAPTPNPAPDPIPAPQPEPPQRNAGLYLVALARPACTGNAAYSGWRSLAPLGR
jgi:hypothetical protein